MELEFSRQIFEKYSNIKFHKNPSSRTRNTQYRCKKLEACRNCGYISFIILGNITALEMYVTMGGVCAAIVVVEKEYVLLIMRVCLWPFVSNNQCACAILSFAFSSVLQ